MSKYKILKFVGCDLEGDACLYVKFLDKDNNFIRFANESELRAMFCPGRRVPEDVADGIFEEEENG